MPTVTTGLDALLTNHMQLGAYTITTPAAMPIENQRRSAAAVETLDGVQFYSWGTFLAGRQITLHWNYMTPDDFSYLETILEADAQVVWRPRTGSDYNVQVMNLSGEYFISVKSDATYRKNVDLTLLIVSEVS